MSQLPADALGRVQAPSSFAKNRVPESGGQLRIDSLNAPGVVPQPVEGQPGLAEQLMSALGVVGQAASVIKDYADERVAFQRGAAASRTAELMPIFAANVQAGTVETPTHLDDISGAVDRNLSTMIPDGVSKAFAEEFRSRMRPAMIQAMTAQTLNNHKANDAELTQAAKDSVALAQDPASIQLAIDALRTTLFFEPTEDEAVAMIALPAARLAAASGDQAAFDAATSVMGDRFAAERQVMTAQMLTTQLQAKAKSASDRLGGIEQMFNDDRPLEMIRQKVLESRGMIGEANAGNFLDRIDREGAQRSKSVQDAWVNEAKLRISLRLDTPENNRAMVNQGIKSGILDADTADSMFSDIQQQQDNAFKDIQQREKSRLWLDASIRKWMPDAAGNATPLATIDEIIRRTTLPPTDPQHLRAEEDAVPLLRFIEQKEKKNDRREKVRSSMQDNPGSQ